MYISAFIWYELCICKPMKNRYRGKGGALEEENENRLASKKEGHITGSENAINTRCKNGRSLYEGQVK